MIELEGGLQLDGVSAATLAEAYGTPLYAYDASTIAERYECLEESFSSTTDVDIRYAMKANANPEIVTHLTNLGAGLDCASPAELDLATSLVSTDDIIFTAPYLPAEELEYAIDAGVTVNLDGTYPLDRMGSMPTRLSFRIDSTARAFDSGLAFSGSHAKFGIPPDRAVRAYALARDRGVERFGIHMMAGSNVRSPAYFEAVTDELLDVAERLATEVDIAFDFVDIGGGFGIPYEPTSDPLDLKDVADRVLSSFSRHARDGALGDPSLIVEPGRYLVGESGVLLTTVTAVKEKRGRTFVGVDTGMHQLIRPMLLDAYHEIVLADDPGRPTSLKADVVGPICSTVDTLATDRPLPAVEAGDLLAIMDVGAYGYALGSHFNSRPRPAEVIASKGEDRLIREREPRSSIFAGTTYEPAPSA